MIKKGFTLQEAMITLAIIGIVAAIAIPRLAKITPDQNHTRYLKAYSLLTDLTNEMLVDPALYFCNDRDGLDCLSLPKPGSVPESLRDAIGQNPTILDKYFNIFVNKVHAQEENIVVNIPNGNGNGNARAFRAKDGIVWIFATDDDDSGILVDIDMDGISNNDIQFVDNQNGQNQNSMPDRFSFNVSMDGTVTAADPMGQFYLDNSTNLHDKNSRKMQSAKELQDLNNNNNRYRPMINVSQACTEHNGMAICVGI